MTLRDGEQQWQRTEYGGFRYLQLTVRSAREGLEVLEIGLQRQLYLFQAEAAFRSSDPLLDRIFEVSAWSHKISSYSGYVGPTWREHAQWVDLIWMDNTAYGFASAEQLRFSSLRRWDIPADEYHLTLPAGVECNLALPVPLDLDAVRDQGVAITVNARLESPTFRSVTARD